MGAVVTKNHVTHPVDTFFPNLDEDPAWELASETVPETVLPGEGDAGVSYSFATYRRVS